MEKKTLHCDILSQSSVKQLQRDLEKYNDSLSKKCEELIRRLAESGITVAKQNVGNFGKYITFSIKTEPNTSGCKGILLATETGKIISPVSYTHLTLPTIA
mgnify:CR=1 FL=1